jgi:hypothetical protein
MDNDDPVGSIYLHKFVAAIAVLLALGYVQLAIRYPLIWAGLTAALFVLGAGLLTTRIVLRCESVAMMCVLTPVFGLAWLLVLYILWMLRETVM